VKYTFMFNNTGIFAVSAMCRVLVVSRSGYYCWRYRRQHPSERKQRRILLDQQVAEAFFARKERSGSPEITLDLQDHGQKTTIGKRSRPA
jgi:putative transposase